MPADSMAARWPMLNLRPTVCRDGCKAPAVAICSPVVLISVCERGCVFVETNAPPRSSRLAKDWKPEFSEEQRRRIIRGLHLGAAKLDGVIQTEAMAMRTLSAYLDNGPFHSPNPIS